MQPATYTQLRTWLRTTFRSIRTITEGEENKMAEHEDLLN